MATAAKTVYSHVTKDPEVCGGKACIDGTRIRVVDIVSLKRQGYAPERMLASRGDRSFLRRGPRLAGRA